MSRFTAWMANRRNTQRRSKGACGGRAARSLGFERCEQRIALTTNAGYELPHLNMEVVGEDEGGYIVLASGNGFQSALVRIAVTPYVLYNSGAEGQNYNGDVAAGQWSWTNRAFGYSYQINSDAIQGDAGLALAGGTRFLASPSGLTGALASNGSFDSIALDDLDFFGFGPHGALITESSVVPIPPPATGHGGNEGGQISMIPFIGPSMFGLPGANESQLAVRTRQALGAEQLESTPDADSSPADSLRGRAVVYEVAQTRPLLTASEEVAFKRADSKNAVDVAGSVAEFETAGRRDGASQNDAMRLASFSFEATSDSEYARNVAVAADRAAMDALFVRESREEQGEAADEEAVEERAKSRVARAHDAAFDRLEQQFAPLEEQREVAAATADANQRRLIGGTLIAVAAVPILKTMRRKGQQQAVEVRPRRSFHDG